MARIELHKLRKTYPGAPDALHDLSLDIADGEFLSLVGPSGCGKSTTLNLLAGLDTPTSGEIRIDGKPVNHLGPSDRDLAMVFQSYALYPHKDVRHNLSFPLEVARLPREQIDRRVRETAASLEIEALLARKPAELSGGQRQRVALGRALVRRPRAYLFDEPLSNLDPGLRVQMRAELKRLHQKLRATFVYVTHDQAEAMSLSDRIAILRAGKLQQVAPPREIYERPANRFVAEFFGTPRINVVPRAILGLSGEGMVGIRPEHLEVMTANPPGSLAAVVELTELTGAETWVTARIGDVQLIARASADVDLKPGQSVRLNPHASRVIELDAQLR